MDRHRLKTILVPAEHGGWGFVGTPVVLGLLVAFSWSGVSLGAAAFMFFLSRQPLKIAAKDVFRKKVYPRTRMAAWSAICLAAVACALLAVGSQGLPLWPLGGFCILALVQAGFDATGRGRAVFPEVVGASAAAAFAGMIVLAGGASETTALAVWLILVVHAALAIAYVSARLRRAKHEAASLVGVAVLAASSIVLGMALVSLGLATWPLPSALVLLAARAGWGLSTLSRSIRTQAIGFQELGYSLLLTALTALSL